MMDPASPIAPSQRIGTLDILRGLALFIVLMINTATEFRVSIFEQFLRSVKSGALADQISEPSFSRSIPRVLSSFHSFSGSAWPSSSNASPDMTVASRSWCAGSVLLAIGVTHLFLIWNGDILTEYAVVGLIALPVLYGPRWLLVAAAALSLALYLASPWLPSPISFPDGAWIAHHVERARQIYGGGSFMEILAFRIEEVQYIAPLHVYVLPRTLGLFLLGAWYGARISFDRPARENSLCRRPVSCSCSAAG